MINENTKEQIQEVLEEHRVLQTGDEQLENSAPPERTPDEQEKYLRVVAKAELQNLLHQTNTLTLGIANHLVSSNGIKQKDKGLAAAALINAILFALDFGVESSKVKLFDKGHKYYKENHTLAAMLVKAMETKMVLLAYKAKDDEARKKQEADVAALSELENELNNEGDENNG